MSRNLIIALGVVLWTAFAIVAFAHALAGDWMGPVFAVIIVATGTSVWHLRRGLAKAS
jgi:hypothetical protein